MLKKKRNAENMPVRFSHTCFWNQSSKEEFLKIVRKVLYMPEDRLAFSFQVIILKVISVF